MRSFSLLSLVLAFLASLSFAQNNTGNQAQFYVKEHQFGFAIAEELSNNGTRIFAQIQAPVSYGWAAIGTGSDMDEALMFIIYPSGVNDGVTLSVRNTTGHEPPKPLWGVSGIIVQSSISNGMMTATFSWDSSRGYAAGLVDLSSKAAPFIWALGPVTDLESPDADAVIQQHSANGNFFVDMTITDNDHVVFPSVSGTESVGTRTRPTSYATLVYIHSFLLGTAFLVIFPWGIIGLRWDWIISFKFHWITQAIGAVGCFIGLGFAITHSLVGIKYNSLMNPHQLLGIAVISLLAVQMGLGFIHHAGHKKVGKRTIVSYAHIILGRLLMYGGMTNSVLGSLLAKKKRTAIVVGVCSVICIIAIEFLSFQASRRPSSKARRVDDSSYVALNNVRDDMKNEWSTRYDPHETEREAQRLT